MSRILMIIGLPAVVSLLIISGMRTAKQGVAGDRHPDTDVNLVYPEDCYLQNGGRVIDVTRLPGYISDHSACKDGTHPDETTDALLDTYDWVVQELKNSGGLSWNHHKAAYIIYFPHGIYAVNKSLIHRGDPWLRDNSQHEDLCGIRFYGQSRDSSIIRLVDDAPAFQDTLSPSTVLAFTKHTQNNSVSLNGMQNLTIHTGSGNPGAVGVDFQGANLSFVRNIKVLSADGKGHAGLRYPIWPTQGYHCDITVEGFDYGIDVVGGMVANGPAFEHITLRNQNRAGFRLQTSISPVRKLLVVNPGGPALEMTSNKSHLVILDSRFEGGPASDPAIRVPAGCQSLYARNLEMDGGFGGICIRSGEEVLHSGNLAGEFIAGRVTTLFAGQQAASLQLPIEESPILPYDPPEKWISVESQGATGGDRTDDSDAIQAAMDACDGVSITTVYFRTGGEFRIGRGIRVPSGVKRMIFMWGGRINTENLPAGKAVFRIDEASGDPLILEDYFQHVNGNRGWFIDHASTRTLVCRNLRGSRDFSNYRHTSSDRDTRLFLENTSHMISEGCYLDNQCWARWINTETADEVEFLNSGGIFWVFGYKCEDEANNFRTVNGGYTEVLGGIINQYRGSANHYQSGRVFELYDSYGSFIASSSGPTTQEYDTIVFEERSGVIKTALKSDFPVREDNKIHVPLFAGYDHPLSSEKMKVYPSATRLGQNRPNPFFDRTRIEYYLDRPSYIELGIWSIRGDRVADLGSGYHPAGCHEVVFEANGGASGLYLYRLMSPDTIISRRMIRINGKNPINLFP